MNSRSEPKFTLTHALFLLYCLFIVWTVLFKNAFSFREILDMFQHDRSRTFNLIPFYYDCEISIRFHIWEVLMNTLLFFPVGVYRKMLDIPSRKAILSGFVLSFVLELCQLIFAVGACDITDLITNTAGTAAGVCLYSLVLFLSGNRRTVNRVFRILALTATILLGLLLLMLFLAND